ncbi:hypothetical protein VTK26DRAFT_8964 [Humicola hyalothermophila]
MLAAHHDQENIYTHQAGASKQQLQAKTPRARYPKTPLKVPLNDENANHGFGGKSVLRTKANNENVMTVGKGGNGLGKSGKQALVTPAEPRTARAPLGNKTTNAKARTALQTPGVKPTGENLQKTTVRPTTNLRPKHSAPQVESSRLEVHSDKDWREEEIEYAPPKPSDIPYESDVFPDGVITFDGLKPENLFKGYYQYYFNPVGDDGKTALEREMDQKRQRNFERGEEQIFKDMEEFDWSIGDLPESKDLFKTKKSDETTIATSVLSNKVVRPAARQPSTIASRKAASALAMTSKPANIAQAKSEKATGPTPAKAPSKNFLLPRNKAAQPVTQPSNPIRERAAAVAASRSTLGYRRGQSTSSAVLADKDPASRQAMAPKPRTLVRSASGASSCSDATITPARFAEDSCKKPDFLSIFDAEADEDEGNLGGDLPPMDDFDDGFQLTVNFK